MAIKRAYRAIYRDNNTIAEAVAKLSDVAESDENIRSLVSFLENAERGIIR